jgi:hypothetical protein
MLKEYTEQFIEYYKVTCRDKLHYWNQLGIIADSFFNLLKGGKNKT